MVYIHKVQEPQLYNTVKFRCELGYFGFFSKTVEGLERAVLMRLLRPIVYVILLQTNRGFLDELAAPTTKKLLCFTYILELCAVLLDQFCLE